MAVSAVVLFLVAVLSGGWAGVFGVLAGGAAVAAAFLDPEDV